MPDLSVLAHLAITEKHDWVHERILKSTFRWLAPMKWYGINCFVDLSFLQNLNYIESSLTVHTVEGQY